MTPVPEREVLDAVAMMFWLTQNGNDRLVPWEEMGSTSREPWMERARAARELFRLREANEIERLRKILDHPDPEDFINASTVEAKFQMDLWGTTEGFPTAFDGQEDHHFVYLIAYLVGKIAATPDEDREKKLHRITTVAAAAANWHIVYKARAERTAQAEVDRREALNERDEMERRHG